MKIRKTNSLREALLKEQAEDIKELKLFIENDGDLYRQKKEPIMKNLARKMLKDQYDSEKAVKLWMYLVDEGAKKYVKEFGSPDDKWHEMFPKAARREVAQQLTQEFEEEVNSGELDVRELADYKKESKLSLKKVMLEQGENQEDIVQLMEAQVKQLSKELEELQTAEGSNTRDRVKLKMRQTLNNIGDLLQSL